MINDIPGLTMVVFDSLQPDDILGGEYEYIKAVETIDENFDVSVCNNSDINETILYCTTNPTGTKNIDEIIANKFQHDLDMGYAKFIE